MVLKTSIISKPYRSRFKAISKPYAIYWFSLNIKTLQNKRYETKDYCNYGSIWSRQGHGGKYPFHCTEHSLALFLHTRPMRDGEVNGKEHFFVKECKTPKEDMLAYTEYGGYEYWTELAQVEDTAIYVIDEKGFLGICEHFPDIELMSIYVAAKPETLKARGIAPERTNRDEYRVSLDINSFDYVISNNSSLYRLLTTTLNVVRCIHPANGEPSKKLAAEAEEKL